MCILLKKRSKGSIFNDKKICKYFNFYDNKCVVEYYF